MSLTPTPFIGQAYVARSPNFADNRLVNLYPETAPSDSKTVAAFFRCPGTTLKATLESQTGSEVRGLWEHNGTGYVVCGNQFYSFDTDYTATVVDSSVLISGTGPVSFADNGTQIVFACNPDMYLYDIAADTVAQITDTDFLGAITVGYLDGYFVWVVPDTQKFQWSAILDGSDIDSLDFASAEGSPDNLVSSIVDHRELWLFGVYSTEVWYVPESGDNAFLRIQGAFIEHGCAAAYSVAKMDNSVFWLGADERGAGIVWRANGYTPLRVSSYAIETAIQGYSTIDDAIAFSYQQDGHSFYFLTFPTANATWVLDVSTGLWHERAYLDADTGDLVRHRANCHVYINGAHIIGDHGGGFTNTGKLYEWDLDVYADNGDEQKWLRSWRALPTGGNNLRETNQHYLQIDVQAGVGLATGQGSDPQVLLRWSDDGGHTWSNSHTRTIGAMGNTGTRVFYRRLGTTEKLRDRVYELSGTDPVKIALTGALLNYTNSTS